VTVYQFQDNFTKTLGLHQLKFGVEDSSGTVRTCGRSLNSFSRQHGRTEIRQRLSDVGVRLPTAQRHWCWKNPKSALR
jgi:hypothetical protein